MATSEEADETTHVRSDHAPDGEVSFRDLLVVLLRRRRPLVLVPFIVGCLVAVIVLLVPSSFTATTAFVPESESNSSLPPSLLGVAGQLGISLGGAAGQSPQFYATTLKSRAILDQVLADRFDVGGGATQTLIEYFDEGGDNSADSLFRARETLARRVDVSVDDATGIVTLGVELESPVLAAHVAERMVQLLGVFNTEVRKVKGRERRVFADGRLREAMDSLRQAEDEMRRFFETNRTWTQSPQLTFEHERLERRLGLWQDMVLSLRREYEAARVAEVNDVPVFTVLYPPEVPVEKSSPRRTLMVIGFAFVAFVLTILWAFTTEYLYSARRESTQKAEEFSRLVEATRADLHRLVGRRSSSSQ